MFDRLETLLEKETELQKILSNPEIIADQRAYRDYSKQYAEITEIASLYREYKRNLVDLSEAQEMLVGEDDDELRELIKEDIVRLEREKAKQEGKLKILLLPKDPSDDKNILLEIRAGAGGEEASLFASDLFRMYTMYAEKNGFSVEPLSSHLTGLLEKELTVFSNMRAASTGFSGFLRQKLVEGFILRQRRLQFFPKQRKLTWIFNPMI
jgi:peptide chain release factor 1